MILVIFGLGLLALAWISFAILRGFLRFVAGIFADSYARRLARDSPQEPRDIPQVGGLGRSGHSRPSPRG